MDRQKELAALLKQADKPNQANPDGYKEKLAQTMLKKKIHEQQNMGAYIDALKEDEMQK